MNEVTLLLNAAQSGDPHAAEQLLPLVYDELRRVAAHRLAHEAPGQTIEPTALVHEAYLRLVEDDTAAHWSGRAGHCTVVNSIRAEEFRGGVPSRISQYLMQAIRP
jgi:hypothetical protein